MRMAFAKRLNDGLDAKGVRERGRAVDVQAYLSSKGHKASTTAIGKWLSGEAIPEKPKIIVLGKWLGIPPSVLEYGEEQEPSPASTLDPTATLSATDIAIPQYDIGGNGAPALKDQPGIIRHFVVNKEGLRSNITTSAEPGNLFIVTGFGDSMPDLYSPGDPVIVDASVKEFGGDGFYFFRIGKDGYIKHLQNIPGEGILAVSQNKLYRDWWIKADLEFEILGRILISWKRIAQPQ